jgi:hypothetical protein
MASDLSIQCNCGSFRGIARGVSRKVGIRVVCYCDDCQHFAHYLGARDTTLDSHGGTDIFQMSPAAFNITQGLDKLACLRLTPKGPLRWYTNCCKTPIGNTPPTNQLPFVGLIHSCINSDGQSLAHVLGSVSARVMVQYAKGDITTLENTSDGFSLSHMARIAWKLLIWRVQGAHKHSPFFDVATGTSIASPLLLSERTRSNDDSANDNSFSEK